MTITFRNKKTRSDRKQSPMRNKIDQFFQSNMERFNGYTLQFSQIKRIERELLSNYKIDEIDDEVLNNYFSLKIYLPRTRYIKQYIKQAEEITNNIIKDDQADAETIYKTVRKIATFSDSTIYSWFKALHQRFTTVGVYNKNVVILVVYLALAKKSKDSNKLTNS
ncbi:hypothetical protein ELBI_49 [Anabaena phage Elbi]|nr:hypothetical protein ELBI_49 [Anabaena phage Elbi]